MAHTTPEYLWKISLLFVSKLFFKIIVKEFPFQISNKTFYLHFKEELLDDDGSNNKNYNFEYSFGLLNFNNGCDGIESFQIIDRVEKEYNYFVNLYNKLGEFRFKQLFKHVKVCQIEFEIEFPKSQVVIDILNNIGNESQTKFTLLFYLTSNKDDIYENSFEPIKRSNLNIEALVFIFPFSCSYYEPTFPLWYKIIEYCKSSLKRLYVIGQKHLTYFFYGLDSHLDSIETLFLGCEYQDTFGRPIFNLKSNRSVKEISFQVADGDGEYVHYSLEWFTEQSQALRHFNYNLLAKDDILEIIVKNLAQLQSFSFYIDSLDLNFFNIYSSSLKLPSSLSQLSIKIKYSQTQSSKSIDTFSSFLLNNCESIRYLNLIFEECLDQHFTLLNSIFGKALTSYNCNLEYLSISYVELPVPIEFSLDSLHNLFDSLNNNHSIKGILFNGLIDFANFPHTITTFTKDTFPPTNNSIYYIKNK